MPEETARQPGQTKRRLLPKESPVNGRSKVAVPVTRALEVGALSHRQPGHSKVTVGSCQPMPHASCISVCKPIFEILAFTSFKEQQGEKPRGQREVGCVGYPSRLESTASSFIRKPNHSSVQICTGEECLPVIYQPWIFTGPRN